MQTTAVFTARVPRELERKARIIAAIRGIPKQDILQAALERSIVEAPERELVERILKAEGELSHVG